MLVWSTIGLFQFCDFIELDLVSVHKKAEKKLANIYPAILISLSWFSLGNDDGDGNENGKSALGL